MAIRTIVTRGYANGGTIALVVTRGYAIASFAARRVCIANVQLVGRRMSSPLLAGPSLSHESLGGPSLKHTEIDCDDS